MGRTDLNTRQFTIYLPSKAHLNSWRLWAKSSGVSLNKYIYEMVERAHDLHLENDQTIRVDVEELARLTEENSVLIIQAKSLQKALEDRDEHDAKIRASRDKTLPVRRALVELLRDKKMLTNASIIDVLKIDIKDIDWMGAIKQQLQDLADLNIISEEPGGRWRWNLN